MFFISGRPVPIRPDTGYRKPESGNPVIEKAAVNLVEAKNCRLLKNANLHKFFLWRTTNELVKNVKIYSSPKITNW